MSRAEHHHNVYVILLDDAVASHPSVLRVNPKRDPAMPCVYVGMTGLPVEHRFENHRHGYKSAWTVRKYGIRLLPELFAHLAVPRPLILASSRRLRLPFETFELYPPTQAEREGRAPLKLETLGRFGTPQAGDHLAKGCDRALGVLREVQKH